MTATKRNVKSALMYLPGVSDVIIEDETNRVCVPAGHIRVTVNGGCAEDIARVIAEILPIDICQVGFCEEVYEFTGSGFDGSGMRRKVRFDHVNPNGTVVPDARCWLCKLRDWFNGSFRRE